MPPIFLIKAASAIVGNRLAKAGAWVIIAAVVALGLWGAISWFTGTVEDARTDGVEQGVTTERAATQAEVIKNVEKANEARNDVRDPRACAAYDECMRSARSAANCVRYLPHDEGCPVQSGTGGGDR